MLNIKQRTEFKVMRLICYKDGKAIHDQFLGKDKLIIGSYSNCDIILDDNHISYYHGMILLDPNGGGRVIDLQSKNGIFVNGKKTSDSFFCVGDTLRFGVLDFHVEEDLCSTEFHYTDKTVEKFHQEGLKEHFIEPVPVEGLTIIDGEYCDITFDEREFNSYSENILESKYFDFSDYIDPIDELKVDAATEKIKNIIKPVTGQRVQVTVLINGHIDAIDFLNAELNSEYNLSHKRHNEKNILIEALDQTIPFIQSNSGEVEFIPNKIFKTQLLSNGQENKVHAQNNLRLQNDDLLSLTYKTIQILVQLVNSPPKLKSAPFFELDKALNKEVGKLVGGVFAFMLLLLLVDITPPEPERKIAIIYKRATKAQTEKRAAANHSKDKNPGTKLNKQNPSKTKMSKKGAKSKTPPKKSAPKPIKKKAIAKSANKKLKNKPKMKAYSFKMKTNLSSLFSSKSVSHDVSKSRSKSFDKGVSGSAVASNSNLKARDQSAIGNLGKDRSGSEGASFGTKGLVSKSGIDTSYMESKTVVMGSMDPELLRKILKEYLPQFRHCYQQELQEHSEKVGGVVDLNFTIGKNGKVTKSDILSKKSKFSRKGVDCMARVLSVIDFPKPKGGGIVDVKQPLNFFSEQ